MNFESISGSEPSHPIQGPIVARSSAKKGEALVNHPESLPIVAQPSLKPVDHREQMKKFTPLNESEFGKLFPKNVMKAATSAPAAHITPGLGVFHVLYSIATAFKFYHIIPKYYKNFGKMKAKEKVGEALPILQSSAGVAEGVAFGIKTFAGGTVATKASTAVSFLGPIGLALGSLYFAYKASKTKKEADLMAQKKAAAGEIVNKFKEGSVTKLLLRNETTRFGQLNSALKIAWKQAAVTAASLGTCAIIGFLIKASLIGAALGPPGWVAISVLGAAALIGIGYLTYKKYQAKKRDELQQTLMPATLKNGVPENIKESIVNLRDARKDLAKGMDVLGHISRNAAQVINSNIKRSFEIAKLKLEDIETNQKAFLSVIKNELDNAGLKLNENELKDLLSIYAQNEGEITDDQIKSYLLTKLNSDFSTHNKKYIQNFVNHLIEYSIAKPLGEQLSYNLQKYREEPSVKMLTNTPKNDTAKPEAIRIYAHEAMVSSSFIGGKSLAMNIAEAL